MAFKKSRRSKFAELVADHVFSHEDRDEFFSVMNGQRITDHFRSDGRPTRPRLDYFPIFVFIHALNLLEQMIVDKSALAD